jgi:hypothetical protein
MAMLAEGASSLLSDQSSTFQNWEHAADISVSRREPPPTKGQLVNSAAVTTLLPKSATDVNSEWTAFLADYERMHRRSWARTKWFPPTNGRGVEVQPVRAPPTLKAVKAWHHMQEKKRMAGTDQNGKTNKRCKTLNLRMDKIVADPTPELSAHGASVVEEVHWEPSQQVLLSETTQNVEAEAAEYACMVDELSQPSRTSMSKKSNSQSSLASSGRFEDNSSKLPTNDGLTLTEHGSPARALHGIGNQGGRIWVQGGGQLKAKTKQTQTHKHDVKTQDSPDALACPVTVMTIEVHIQCREGQAGVNDSRRISMTPDSDRDRVLAVVCVFGKDPGGGEAFEFLERICVFVPLAREVDKADTTDGKPKLDICSHFIRRSIPQNTMGVPIPFLVECVKDEHQLLLRFASIVRMKDPDMLLSWDTQGAGLGYLIERGVALGKNASGSDSSPKEIDMARLLGRTPRADPKSESDRLGQLFRSEDAAGAALSEIGNRGDKAKTSDKWKGSGLGSEWDERVGAGAAAASIVSMAPFLTMLYRGVCTDSCFFCYSDRPPSICGVENHRRRS